MRLRSNFQQGTLDVGVSSAAITLQAASFATLPVVSNPDYLVLVLEPDSANEEIVHVTAHTSASSSVTVTRAQESTTTLSHDAGVAWVHGPTAADYVTADTDGTMAADSDLVVPTQKAVVTYVAANAGGSTTIYRIGAGGGAPAYKNGWVAESSLAPLLDVYISKIGRSVSLWGAMNGDNRTNPIAFTLPMAWLPVTPGGITSYVIGCYDAGSAMKRVDIDLTTGDVAGSGGGGFYGFDSTWTTAP